MRLRVKRRGLSAAEDEEAGPECGDGEEAGSERGWLLGGGV